MFNPKLFASDYFSKQHEKPVSNRAVTLWLFMCTVFKYLSDADDSWSQTLKILDLGSFLFSLQYLLWCPDSPHIMHVKGQSLATRPKLLQEKHFGSPFSLQVVKIKVLGLSIRLVKPPLTLNLWFIGFPSSNLLDWNLLVL
ncbi:hypothetical protein NPIL_373381 [Nephila pilipes]|uniref:Uncharacterized protein n=1 Tax=Nephila pilipes TaxID=299642 RepID=A0A8X6I8S0_NEPPI|nr:hypothetical protein NPIL_373381 [Nephila pilipes]